MKTVAQKMGIKEGRTTYFVDAPADAIDAINHPELKISTELKGEFDYIHFFVKEESDLSEKFKTLKEHLNPAGMLWVSWPKGGQLGTNLNLKIVIRIGYNFGLVESTCLSINSTWSGLKFTHPKEGKVYNNSYGKLNQ